MQLVDRCDTFLLFSEFFFLFFYLWSEGAWTSLGLGESVGSFYDGPYFPLISRHLCGEDLFWGPLISLSTGCCFSGQSGGAFSRSVRVLEREIEAAVIDMLPFFQMIAALNIERESEPKQLPSRNVPAVNKQL